MSLAINGTDGIDFNLDAAKIKLGVDDDLNIYHDGTDSYIDNKTGYVLNDEKLCSVLSGHDHADRLA